MDINSELQISKLNNLTQLYIQVKEAILLAENFDPDHSVYLSPVNELRNVLDHVMRSFTNPNKIEEEFHEAKEHLFRAGYDAFEVLSINIGDKIVKCVEEYDVEVISLIFPYYYTEIRKHLVNIKVELARVRALKKTEPSLGITSFLPYQEKINELISHLQVCQEQIPALQLEKIKRKRKGFLNGIMKFILGVLVGILILIIYDTSLKPKSLPKVTPEKIEKKL